MATIKAFIRVSKTKNVAAKVRFRLSDGRVGQFFHTSEITIDPKIWDAKTEGINPKVPYDKDKRNAFNKLISDRKRLILNIFSESTQSEKLEAKWLDKKITSIINPVSNKPTANSSNENTFFRLYDQFLNEKDGTDRIKQHYKAVKRMLMRFEIYHQIKNPDFKFMLDNVDTNLLRSIETYLINEHLLFKSHGYIFETVPDSRPPKQKGKNRRNKIFRYVRTFFNWAIHNEYTTNNPFSRFKIKEDVVGSPIYISIEERNHLMDYDLSAKPRLAIQRDVFVFQCLIGCRVGDLVKLRNDNIIDSAVEYIPRKTKDGRPVTVRVPLNATAKKILSRYSNIETSKLLPFISKQKYNDAIKDIFEMAGLTRMVTVINTISGNEEKKSLNQVASSHLARRTFAGNLYKKVKDPSLVGSLTGHKEGSRAFARYRMIDDDIKNDLVKLLE